MLARGRLSTVGPELARGRSVSSAPPGPTESGRPQQAEALHNPDPGPTKVVPYGFPAPARFLAIPPSGRWQPALSLSKGSRNCTEGEAEAEEVVAAPRLAAIAESGAAIPGGADPTATADDSEGARVRARRIGDAISR